ncbi:hypothetical protein BP00DRAFT_442746 [Aspergillus indologenus CBS 114.80]|uniref:Uncharacterized protein n=1 Tax=Aspergillus indologenus CBS 114.80 TaxID=1450541 RepID=A0A2V5IMS5_9EURO|nr:hypothetical protein BP00DRAFT_442746 [Aspergillus indologenus CBS 114.80]
MTSGSRVFPGPRSPVPAGIAGMDDPCCAGAVLVLVLVLMLMLVLPSDKLPPTPGGDPACLPRLPSPALALALTGPEMCAPVPLCP